MSIGSISSSHSTSPYASTSALMPTTEPVANADGDGSVRSHRRSGGHGGAGGIGQAVMDALQSLGVSMPVPPGPPPADSAGSPSSDRSSRDAQGAPTSGTVDIGRDVKQLMGALFEALQGAAGASASSGTATASDSRGAPGAPGASGSAFAANLSALISQAANGSVSSELQDAFTKLSTDLKAASGSGSTVPDSADTGLQAFLGKLQDRLGYGAASSGTTTGNLISATA